MRLNKFIAESGYCSRRKADEFIFAGNVKVNNQTCTNPAIQVDEINDTVSIFKTLLKPEVNKVYYLLNKPVRIVSSAADEKGRETVIDLIKSNHRIYPVGRLDFLTSGIILLTNDGELTKTLTHPSSEVIKKYHVVANRDLSKEEITKLENGVIIDHKKTSKARIFEHKKNQFLIEIHEGRNRQIRKMLEAIGAEVVYLDRVEFAGLTYSSLKRGEYRELKKTEIERLKNYQGRKNG